MGLDSTFTPVHESAGKTLAVSGLGSTIPSTLRKTTRESLISTWRTKAGSRQAYEERASHHLDLKVRFTEIAPQLLAHLEAIDAAGEGYVHQHQLQRVLLLHFGILLGAAELACLTAEWQVIDPVSLHVDYHGLISYCAPGTLAQHESESIRPRRREELFLHTTTRSRA